MENTKNKEQLYDELVEALKDTHNLYVEAVKDNYMTHDITRIMGNDNIFKRIKNNISYVSI